MKAVFKTAKLLKVLEDKKEYILEQSKVLDSILVEQKSEMDQLEKEVKKATWDEVDNFGKEKLKSLIEVTEEEYIIERGLFTNTYGRRKNYSLDTVKNNKLKFTYIDNCSNPYSSTPLTWTTVGDITIGLYRKHNNIFTLEENNLIRYIDYLESIIIKIKGLVESGVKSVVLSDNEIGRIYNLSSEAIQNKKDKCIENNRKIIVYIRGLLNGEIGAVK